MHHRIIMLGLWVIVLASAAATYIFHPGALKQLFLELPASPPSWVYAVHFALGCLRGFTLIPATYLVMAGMLVLPPWPLYLITVIGIIVSSAAVYYFAEAMVFDRFFERRYGAQVARLRGLMQRRELPIVIAWSFLPIAPTDLICYVCGALKVDLRKCLLGVTIGEGAICAIYIFVGAQALAWLR
jgi:uncharacterized membrane protein YdjX (TVP38/TMEM64 family)